MIEGQKCCSKCKSFLGNKIGKQRYCQKCKNASMRLNRLKYCELSELEKKKSNARSYTHVLIKRGKIKKENCCICNSSRSEVHHVDYDKPKEIVWFCRLHHLEHHKLF
jgi:hypothetical protein